MAGDINNLLGLSLCNPRHSTSRTISRRIEQYQIDLFFELAHTRPIIEIGNHKLDIGQIIALSIGLGTAYQTLKTLNTDYSIKMGCQWQGEISTAAKQIHCQEPFLLEAVLSVPVLRTRDKT